MAIPSLAKDFKEFLKLLNSNKVEYLVIGGYVVGTYGYIRATNDLDIWVKTELGNSARINRALDEFGFSSTNRAPELFLTPHKVVRMGVPPIRIEVLTSISGVEFDVCYAEKELVKMDDIVVPVISLARLRENKAASGRPKDLADLDNLPTS